MLSVEQELGYEMLWARLFVPAGQLWCAYQLIDCNTWQLEAYKRGAKSIVYDNMACCRFNHPETLAETDAAIAQDMINLASDCEYFTIEQIVPYIGEWKAEHGY